MQTKHYLAMFAVSMLAATVIGCGDSTPPPDEGKLRWFGNKPATVAELEDAAKKYYQPASENYFEDMDGVATDGKFGKLELGPEEIKGRNAWVIWSGGNEAFWDWLARHSYGSIDLLKLIDSKDAGRRFGRIGAITEPGMREPNDEETREAHGIRYTRPTADHVEAKGGKRHPPNPDYYGYPSGVVGLRLFPNPEFTGSAKAAWERAHERDSQRFYNDYEYASRADTIRPFRVGMSCGFCHIAPHPLSPPKDPEAPEWKNLSNNIGNQYLRFRGIFANNLKPDNYLYHVLDAQHPGTIDTSLVASDNINNANTINAVYGLKFRIARMENNPKETIGSPTFDYLRNFVKKDSKNPDFVPRVLLDGSDSVGVNIALARVYLNIGTYHQEWVKTHNPLLGFRKQAPFTLKNTVENSVYWHATRLRIEPMIAFFLKSTDPMLLKDAPLDAKQREKHLKNGGVPWDSGHAAGRKVFAKGCIACHSSIQPGDRPDLEIKITLKEHSPLPEPQDWEQKTDAEKRQFVSPRQALRLRPDDLVRLTRGDGTLPPGYKEWAEQAVNVMVKGKDKEIGLLWKDNYLSTDARIPVTVTRTNSARAMATNALHGNVWEDFASQTYKELDSVGRVSYKDPFSLSEKTYLAPSGGPGYYRVPTLISAWATAPFLHNNALGRFNNDPSVEGRLAAFDDAIEKLLWPQKRREPTKQVVWGVDDARPKEVDNATAEQIEKDGGWVWRTTEESWFSFYGHDIPIHVAGLTGWPPFWVALLPWLPTLILLSLATIFLLIRRKSATWEKLIDRRPALVWFVTPFQWLVGMLAVLLAVAWIWFVHKNSLAIEVIDLATMGSLHWLWLQAYFVPFAVFLSVAVLLFPERYWTGPKREKTARILGVVCVIFAVSTAFGFGRFLSGHGGPVKFGAIPKGVPVNLIANMDPNAPLEKKQAALKALSEFVVQYHGAKGAKPGLKEFEENVAPAFMAASKCPDFIMDRGHDYEFMLRMSDDEKRALIALLKTF